MTGSDTPPAERPPEQPPEPDEPTPQPPAQTPQPPEEPEQEGLPDHAADTSTAYDEGDRPRFDDSPASLPADRPQAVEEFGTTGPEARQGEPLADRLAREQPEVSPEQRYPSPERSMADEVVTEATEAQVARDAEVVGSGPEPSAGEVSDYDVPEPGGPVGRLVEPDEGARPDTEKDVVATDPGEAGGGLSAEEAAMHEAAEDEVPYER